MRSLSLSFLTFLGHSLPVASGLGMFAEMGWCQWAVASLGQTAEARLRSGLRLIIDPTEYLGRTVLLTGEWDPKVTWVCQKLLRNGDTFIDIGAHCGVVAVEAARLVGPSGKVHAFEPQPRLAEFLRQSASINALSGLQVHQVALSDQDGQAKIFMRGGKQILASLVPTPGVEPNLEITTRAAEPYLRGLNLTQVQLLKMDIEGYEYALLQAMEGVLNEGILENILFESVPAEGPFWERPAVQLLAKAGYQFYALPKTLLTFRAVPVSPGVEPAGGPHDFVAVRNWYGPLAQA